MDIIQILSTIKGKVLDAANFELLKTAYGLQNQNIEQLKNNNTALKESNDLLKEKINSLNKDNSTLKERVLILEDELRLKKEDSRSQGLSEVALAILGKCIKHDVTEFNDESMLGSLSPYSRIQVESAIDELEKLQLIYARSIMGGFGEGTDYSLTAEGKKAALKIPSE